VKRRLWPWLVVPALCVTALVVYFAGRYPEALDDGGGRLRLTYLVLLLALVGGSAVLHWRQRPRRALRHALAWAGIALVLLIGYSYRHAALRLGERLMGDLMPQRGTIVGGAVSFRAAAGGHFLVEAEVNGVALRLLVDTGASDVVLSPADAQHLGFDLAALDYSRRYRTANGIVFGAPVRLGRVRVGPIALDDVRASVNGAEMARSLLGMSFLGRLSGYEVSDDTLTLRP
jgi:aspartyl protease family protein